MLTIKSNDFWTNVALIQIEQHGSPEKAIKSIEESEMPKETSQALILIIEEIALTQ